MVPMAHPMAAPATIRCSCSTSSVTLSGVRCAPAMATFPIFPIWMYISWLVVLLVAELCAVMPE